MSPDWAMIFRQGVSINPIFNSQTIDWKTLGVIKNMWTGLFVSQQELKPWPISVFP